MKRKVLLKQALLAAAFFAGLPANVYADSTIGNGMIVIDGNSSGTLSSDMTCTLFVVEETSTLTVNQGVTLTFSDCSMIFEGQSRVELHGTLTGNMDIHTSWEGNSYINVYLSDGAKYTVTGLTCDDGDSYLVYYGYDAATDGNGTVSVKNGTTDVTSTSTGYKTTTYTFTATPASGYKFKNWTKGAGGEVLGTDASINVTCEQNGTYQVYANFEEDAVAVAVTGNSDGKTTPSYWATYYNGTTSYTADANTTVYKAAMNGTSSLTLTAVADIPAGQAVILKSSSDNITLTPAASTTADLSDNVLKGGTTVTSGYDAYTLSRGSAGTGTVGFYKFNGTSLDGSKAHLEIAQSAGARGFIGFGDDGTTAIEAPTATIIVEDGEIYDLTGRRIEGQPARKGIYVKNGQKFIVK